MRALEATGIGVAEVFFVYARAGGAVGSVSAGA